MCLSVPAKVIRIEGHTAEVSVGGAVFNAGLQMLSGIKPGDYILLHAGFAIQKISPEEAEISLSLLKAVNNAQQD